VGVLAVLFDEALKQAQDLDTEFANTKKLRGPLHGVPVSIKVGIFVSTHALQLS
jgi:Asp-tRNA(Asn)/Glu-tRNA(Gln) amidotransferase A subunit family amidase